MDFLRRDRERSILCDAHDRLSRGALLLVEGAGRVGERHHAPDDGLEPSRPYPSGEVGETCAVRFDEEVQCPSVARLGLGWLGEGDQRSSGAYERDRTFHDLSADHVEHHVDLPGVFELVIVQVEESVGAQLESPIPIGGPPGADDPRPHLTSELHRNGADTTCRTVDQHGLSRDELRVLEQALPRGQPRDRQRRGQCVVDVVGQRCEVTRLHCGVLGQGAVACPVCQSEHALTDRETCGAVSQFDHNTRQFVSGHTGCAVASRALGPRIRPVEFAPCEPRGVHTYDDVVLGDHGIGQFCQRQTGDAGITIGNCHSLHCASS
ncbi:hypothetical protein MSMEG_4444 [Mycolicibacterium smegmatis MC2 155]|uniref:Uncharacterized protein n=1 Tax=Mycolicibacterium smegmatis (strain ATCC 700084 / mc(2)155) TaxID=246196 RepID=A0R0M9_MYCS2|nr:hypothetical protein MSMEG_4444 [Mycolicibacterium smegmatis MC2 155]